MLRKLLQPIYLALVLLSFVLCLLLAMPFFLVQGFRKNLKGRRAIWLLVHVWAKGWLWLIGMPLRVSGTLPGKGKYIYVANHISYLDTINIYAAIPGYFRTLAKMEMARVPLFGFVYSQITILVNRQNAHSRARSMRLMGSMLRKECSITIFPEGTFNETDQPLKDFYDGAFRLAISSQVPIIPLVFPDTVHRWNYTAWYKIWPGRNRAIFLPEVSVEGMGIKDLPALKEQVAGMMAGELENYGYPKS